MTVGLDGRIERILQNEGVINEVFSKDRDYPCGHFIPDYALLDDLSVWEDIESKREILPRFNNGLFRIRTDETEERILFYLSFLIASREYSSRGVYISSLVIKYNPANYTAWTYRMDCVERLQLPLPGEMEFARKIAYESPKSYQAWQYRRRLCQLHNDPYTEHAYIKYEIMTWQKNHCAWAHLSWLMTHFPVTKEQAQKEMDFVHFLLSNDMYNNTAWVYKMFLFENCGYHYSISSDLRGFYVDFTKLLESPWNESLANYLIQLVTLFGKKHKGCLQLASCGDDCTGGLYVCANRAIDKSKIMTTPLLLLKKHIENLTANFAPTADALKINDPLRS